MCLYNYQKTCIPKGKEQLYFQHHLCFGPEVSYVLCQKVIMQETGSTKDWIYWKFLTCATWQCNEVFKEGKSFKNKFVVYFVFFFCSSRLFWFHFWFVFDQSVLLCSMCSEFKRHLLHFSCIPHCQILLPPVIWMLNYCWHGYARKENVKPEPQIIADPFKVPKPLMRSLMQRVFSKAD